MTGEFPRPIPRHVWLTARARNAVRRPIFVGAVAVCTLIAVIVALWLAPEQIQHLGDLPSPTPHARQDTAPLVAALAQARTRLASEDSSLQYARAHAMAAPKPSIDTLSPLLTARRDSLSTAVNDLDALLARVETAPVTASYRALAESPRLAQNPRAKLLLDSLGEIERDRESYGSAGGADPVYVALTSRSTEIGREIQNLAQSRRDTLRDQVARLTAAVPQQAVAVTPTVDTASWIAERDSAQSLQSQAVAALTDARAKAHQYDVKVAQAREEAKFETPTVALLAAALVFGIAAGFGVAFGGELREPRISDEHELERVTGARVLATVRPRAPSPDRQRRATDREAPPYFDPGSDGYQLAYLHVARAGASRIMLTVASVDPALAAVVATNVAAIAAAEARTTILVDTIAGSAPVAAALRMRAEPGIVDILGRHTDWAGATTQSLVGRDRLIDVVPSGVSNNASAADVTELFREEAPRLLRHYDAIVVVASVAQAVAGLPGALPIADTILCAQIGRTPFAEVQAALDGIRQAGGHPLGVVLWDAPRPSLPSSDRIAHAPRPLQTAEMRAMTTTR
jgi:Mrp family chromosome partitioning ATPase